MRNAAAGDAWPQSAPFFFCLRRRGRLGPSPRTRGWRRRTPSARRRSAWRRSLKCEGDSCGCDWKVKVETPPKKTGQWMLMLSEPLAVCLQVRSSSFARPSRTWSPWTSFLWAGVRPTPILSTRHSNLPVRPPLNQTRHLHCIGPQPPKTPFPVPATVDKQRKIAVVQPEKQ